MSLLLQLVYPSSFNTPSVAAVVPIESLHTQSQSSSFPYGPRALNVQQVQHIARKSKPENHEYTLHQLLVVP